MTQRTLQSTWAVITKATGRPLHTFSHKDMAVSWFEEHNGWDMGLEVVRLKTIAETVDVPRPRQSLFRQANSYMEQST